VTITAEGVETEEQAKLLRDYGCPQVQGFLYGYPAPMNFASIAPSKLKAVKAESSAA
jgi:EAL domain-containing protein (putative c-di-GMP-specific phosphodiesterase class I)